MEHKDVVIAMLGAAAALAGFVLVFLGVVITSFLSFPPETAGVVRRKFQLTAATALVTFLVCLVTVALGVVWLATSSAHGLYGWMIGLFFAALALAFAVGVATTVQAIGR
jgi:hypothetical protein